MSNFWDKPTEVEHEYVMQLGEGSDLGHIPWFGPNPHAPPIQPPDGLLDDKEYIVFHAFLPTSGLIMEDFFISSFGRFLHKPDNRWYDMSSNLIHQMGVTPTPIVLGRRQWTKDYWRGWAVLEESDVPLRDGGYGPWRNMTPAPLCFINQGWVQLLHFLAYNGRLTGGVFTRRENGSQHGEMFGFIPKLLNLYAQLFPESIITETNNDPDVFFRKKQTNPEVLEILSKMDEYLESDGETTPKWRTDAKNVNYDDLLVGSTILEINSTTLKAYKVYLPPLEIQEKIVEECNSKEKIINLLKENITQAEKQVNEIMNCLYK